MTRAMHRTMPRTKAGKSIAFRLIAAVLLVELASSLLVGFLSLGYERHIHFGVFDTMLRGRVDSVLGAVQDSEDANDDVMLDQRDLHLPREDVYEVYDAGGRLLGRSPNWQGTEMPPAPRRGHDKFWEIELDGAQYRLLMRHGSRIVDPGERGGGKLRRVTVLYGAPTARLWGAIRAAVEFYAAGSILLLVVTGPLIAWLLHRGLLPLRQLAALASRVSADSWQFSPPASARATPELAPLTHALESVLQRLERSFTQQRAFVSDAAHELKTAVAVVKSSLQLLGLRPRTPAEYQAGIDRGLADTQRLEELVAKMLTLARVESGAQAAAQPETDFAECLSPAIAQLATVAALRRVDVNVETSSGEFPAPSLAPNLAPYPASFLVRLTAEDCSLLLSNLLLNALQHSPPESRVRLRLVAKPEPDAAAEPPHTHTGAVTELTVAELTVEDRGEGIDPAALPRVFDRFYRGDPSRTRSTGGAGLGLAICKAIVERAGGSIALASKPGEGTTVTVRLPIIQKTAAES
ncbi:MAG: sensor histidine kinase [Terracidiphilus sp.]